MIQKYNIAFTPSTNSDQFIQYAQALSQTAFPDTYLLGTRSIPHVSLCQFEIEKNKIEHIWEMVTALNLPNISLIFNEHRSKSYDGHPKWGGVYWVSLIPDQINLLTEVHLQIAKIVKTPLNASFSEYDPHLTLCNSHAKEACALLNQAPKVSPALNDEFHVSLGTLDDVGQITEILF